MNRKIIHVDVDAFYASVEQIDNPKLKGKPVIVGGISSRGVVSTCSYEARKYGVHSAMPIFQAKKLCPEGIYISGRHDRYDEMSKKIFALLHEITDDIEIVSIDEAYLDVTYLYHTAEYIGKYIKNKIKKETGLTVSVGISYNKFLAKLASEWDKPDGFFVIKKEDIPEILKPLPIIKIHGIGKKTVEKLNKIGIYSIEDLLLYDLDTMVNLMGTMGEEIYERIRGVDNREIKTHSERKSIGTEMTFTEDIDDFEEIIKRAEIYLHEVVELLIKKKMLAKTVMIKIKFDDFTQVSRSKSLEVYTDDEKYFGLLLNDLLHHMVLKSKVRLLGVTLSGLINNHEKQLMLFDLIGEDNGK
ncbi:MAG: DNA polymerase IV [Clostridiales bacterium]|nr:DNA polymerase IV [Clostridiales bacterium]